MTMTDINWDTDQVDEDFVAMVFATNFEHEARIKARDLVSEEYNRQITDLNVDDTITLEDVWVTAFEGTQNRWMAFLTVDSDKVDRYFSVSYRYEREEIIIETYFKTKKTTMQYNHTQEEN